MRDSQGFERFITATTAESFAPYREAATPRSHVEGHIYTSTDFPPQYRIYLHNENSHVTTWPARLYFFCQTAPSRGGQTPIADCRAIWRRLDPALRDRFARLGWLYVRTFGHRLGLSWQTAFGVETKEELHAYCRRNSMLARWDGEQLRVSYRRWAALRHPRTGDDVWFNHGLLYNGWNLTPEQKQLAEAFGTDRMPYQTFYGDGSPVPAPDLEQLHQAYEAEKVLFDWQEGDVLMIDNMLAAHGREAYEGNRRVLVGMTGTVDCTHVVDAAAYALPGDAR